MILRSLWLLLLLAAGPVYAAGDGGEADSPTEVCKKMIEAVKRADLDTALKFASEERRAEEADLTFQRIRPDFMRNTRRNRENGILPPFSAGRGCLL